jgi:Kef-type K+ transport system membrane component KefB
VVPALVFSVFVLGLFGVTLWAGVDAGFQPEQAWRSAGISRGVTVAIVVFGCALGAAYYFALVRPRLLRQQRL